MHGRKPEYLKHKPCTTQPCNDRWPCFVAVGYVQYCHERALSYTGQGEFPVFLVFCGLTSITGVCVFTSHSVSRAEITNLLPCKCHRVKRSQSRRCSSALVRLSSLGWTLFAATVLALLSVPNLATCISGVADLVCAVVLFIRKGKRKIEKSSKCHLHDSQ